MSDSISVRITLDSYDLMHPREKQTQVYVQIPEVARASWLLPEDHFHFSKREPWPNVVDSAQEHYVQSGTVSDSASAAARQAVIEWLMNDANHDAMQAAWEANEVRQHRVARKLLEENKLLRARVAELEDAAYGDAKVRLIDPVGQIRHLHACVAAQKHRADTLDRLCREQRTRADKAESKAAEPEGEPLMVYRASHDSIVAGLYTTMAAAREHCEALLRSEYPRPSRSSSTGSVTTRTPRSPGSWSPRSTAPTSSPPGTWSRR